MVQRVSRLRKDKIYVSTVLLVPDLVSIPLPSLLIFNENNHLCVSPRTVEWTECVNGKRTLRNMNGCDYETMIDIANTPRLHGKLHRKSMLCIPTAQRSP